MNDKLILLLNYYTREQRALAKQLREAQREQDYHIAARIQKGQFIVAQQLRSLRILQNKHADELDQLARWIHHLKKTKTSLPAEAQFYSARLDHYEQQQQKLRAASLAPSIETSVIQNLMKNLLAGQIEGFSLVLSKSTRLSFSIRRVRRTAILTFSEVLRHRNEHNVYKKQLRQLRKLGFAYHDRKDKLLALEPLVSAEDVERIMELWMKITCLVFGFRHFHDEAEIRYFQA